MEHLEKLKDIWKNQEESAIRFSDEDIHNMLQKKSTSIVKWILIISILEFVLPNLIYLVTDHDASRRIYENYGLTNLTMVYTAIHVVIICVFIYFFYKNYKNICVDSSVKELLHNILKTRKTVKYYIYYNLTMAAIIGVHIFYIVFNSESFLVKIPENLSLVTVWLVALLLLSISIFIFWIFYRVLYGILLKKLNMNYNELLRSE